MKNKKPLIDMSPTERERAFDEIGARNSSAMLTDCRAGETSEILIAVAYLMLPDGTEGVYLWDCEYGDGEGTRHVDDEIASILRLGLLKKGETLRRDIMKVIVLASVQNQIQ